MTKQYALVDTDVLCHQFAYRNTQTVSFDDGDDAITVLNPEKAKVQVEGYIIGLMEQSKCDDAVLVLSDPAVNFRKQLDPTYKLSRVDTPKPALWHVIRKFVEDMELGYRVECWPRLEGDDVMGILHTGEFKDRSVIVSIDKDMNTIPGRLYNPGKPALGIKRITRAMAEQYHLGQALTGDTTDGYPGCPGAGPGRLEKLLAIATDNQHLWTPEHTHPIAFVTLIRDHRYHGHLG